MAKGPEDTPAERIRLATKLRRDLSKLRSRGSKESGISDLTDLLPVAAAYAPDASSDFDRIRILVLGATAKRWGRSKFATAIQMAYGLHPQTRGLRPGERYKIAHRFLGENSESNFTTHVLPDADLDLARRAADFYFDKEVAPSGDALLSSLETEQASKQPDIEPEAKAPISAHAQRRPSTVHSDDRSPTKSRNLKLAGAIGAIVVIAALFKAVTALVDVDSAAEPLPTRGTVINALTGQVVEHPKLKPEPKGDLPGMGFLIFCDLTMSPNCSDRPKYESEANYPPSDPFLAHVGDLIEATLTIWNNDKASLPYFTLTVERGGNPTANNWPTQVSLGAEMVYVSGPDETSRLDPSLPESPSTGYLEQTIEAKGAKHLAPKYVQGSTRLLNPSKEVLAKLPDGVMSASGIALTSLGSPPRCLCYSYEYRRTIAFRFKLIDVIR